SYLSREEFIAGEPVLESKTYIIHYTVFAADDTEKQTRLADDFTTTAFVNPMFDGNIFKSLPTISIGILEDCFVE
ncbi:MAG: hypothetical protein MJ189_03560, partial [Coriobacteriales bacterium]|nr:hypothetical protein [Coriobacteriales bacterium]